jgi:predicted RNA binding protein YcfA (HicA-like mRNA interferase family)
LNKKEFIETIEELGFKQVESAESGKWVKWKHPTGYGTCPEAYADIPSVNGITAYDEIYAILREEVFLKTLEQAGMVFTQKEAWAIVDAIRAYQK